uniref:Uncharacterized protein n=1 Tax=Parascaris univalens TaxID=6257 RepID=A0A915CJJ9_PARUN
VVRCWRVWVGSCDSGCFEGWWIGWLWWLCRDMWSDVGVYGLRYVVRCWRVWVGSCDSGCFEGWWIGWLWWLCRDMWSDVGVYGLVRV